MKPLQAESEDNDSLRALGRASIQIVHDLKNQLNGLKLYATFLRKRLEKSERPADELETIGKLISGLDRTADDLSLLVQYGEPLEIKRQPSVDLQRIMSDVAATLKDIRRPTGELMGSIVVNFESVPLVGQFDSARLADAFRTISLGALKMLTSKSREPLKIQLRGEASNNGNEGIIEWRLFDFLDHDPFHSFAGSDEIRMSLAAKIIEAHGGTAERHDGALRVRLPLA